VFVGPGQHREAQLIGLGLRKLRTFEREDIERAKRYALDQSVKFVMLKQREAHQQQVNFIRGFISRIKRMTILFVGAICILFIKNVFLTLNFLFQEVKFFIRFNLKPWKYSL